MLKNEDIMIFGIVLLIASIAFIGSTSSVKSWLVFEVDVENLSYALPYHDSICIPDTLELCSSDGLCENIKPTTFLLIDNVAKKYSRCDNQPCDTYDATFTQSGKYTIVRPLSPKHGEIKIAQDKTYTETNTLGDDIYISQGICSSTK